MLSERLGREVNAVVVAPEDWDDAESGFLQEVKRCPLVPVHLESERA
jgi:hypothetical protein